MNSTRSVVLPLAAMAAILFEQRNDVMVDFDDVQRACTLEQGRGNRAAARAYLDQPIARLGVDGADDALDRAGVMQEMLAIALFGKARPHQLNAPRFLPRPLRSSASANAACRLPASAFDVPARSSAVP